MKMADHALKSVLYEFAEDVSSIERELRRQSLDPLAFLSEDALITRVDSGSEDGELSLLRGEFGDVGNQSSSSSVVLEASRRRVRSIYTEVLQSYEELQRRSGSLEEIKKKILSYVPGSWMEKVAGIKLGDYYVPEITSLLLIGPKGSGKSSLINKISRVLENEKFLPERAQVSYNSSAGEGTYFLQEYPIPRGSNSFCLYDTRSLSDDPSENTKIFIRWMTQGVRSGELVKRASDCSSLKTTMKYRARYSGNLDGKVRMVNFVIMVVNGLSVLESMDSADEGKKLYTQFNNPIWSFKDDKPAVVVTHGDLLALSDRVRVRVHLGELLGIPPRRQIFDIADGNDPAIELSIADLLYYCLEHADKNLPLKTWRSGKMDPTFVVPVYLLLFMVVLGIGILLARLQVGHTTSAAPSHTPTDWQAIRHLWLGEDYG